ncbi:D-tyrosyl-tRNA(Tyr) deacylase [Ignicoccus islandicus DSM 13165]|uniref:D-aminoacyl-tRNA deacylase n=1 Tax=Ignicoccus islandicus DSM 13165 TaxID=940295 RepID=A0A0U3E7W8_9CREN|nr:D-aminoacyl-tRNA deacylase [Ignicoccus islandicus]ALU11470.1 D-tyrosyl-tRNA(Tyr) deacylase [Ignicoccus islandicus DSM 13165]
MLKIVYSPNDPAAKGVAERLMKEGIEVYPLSRDAPFSDFSEVEGDDFIVLSRHSSEKRVKAFTVHFTGNFSDEAKLGGQPRTLSIALPKIGCKLLNALSKYNYREDYEVVYEATHHGPTINKGIVFIEIGSSLEDWTDPRNHDILAKAVLNYEEMEDLPSAIWIGGPHYNKRAAKRCFEGINSIGHIAPKYVIGSINEDLLVQMVEKSRDPIERAYVEKKSVKAEQRKKIVETLKSMGLSVEVV